MMSQATLERVIVASARVILKNPQLRQKDLIAWGMAKSWASAESSDEVSIHVPDQGCWAVFPKSCDKRPS